MGESVYTAEFWQYSANLGRRWNVDPITFPNISPYATFNNNPIIFTDVSGASPEQGDPVKETQPNYNPSGDNSLLKEVVVTATRINSPPSALQKTMTYWLAAADAYLSDILLKPSTFLSPKDYGGGEFGRIAREGHKAGHIVAAAQGVGEIVMGDGMISGGGVALATGVGTAPGAVVMVGGAGAIAHGTVMTALATHKLIRLQMEETNSEAHNNSDAVRKMKSGEYGSMIGWGEGQSDEAVEQTLNLTKNLTKSQVKGWAEKGLPKSWVEAQLPAYSKSLSKGGNKLKNTQILPRKELMEKILELWE